ncbi:hypothetical protein HMPREF0322_03997 [Desulfitobacterium hafniense DP7]|uniref:Uncharacterized protein n=1 Tax=Desulfitobacterium hafniense DP7 TaxID=537010 RepID=G9XSP6_DESHA|nr:hypothetical protein HMPREF0322_03997 [Desulfitobacterium hafniense DP7]
MAGTVGKSAAADIIAGKIGRADRGMGKQQQYDGDHQHKAVGGAQFMLGAKQSAQSGQGPYTHDDGRKIEIGLQPGCDISKIFFTAHQIKDQSPKNTIA